MSGGEDGSIVAQVVVLDGESNWWLFLADGPVPDPFDSGEISGWYLYPDTGKKQSSVFRAVGGKNVHNKNLIPHFAVIARDIPLAPATTPRVLAWRLADADRKFIDGAYSAFLQKERAENPEAADAAAAAAAAHKKKPSNSSSQQKKKTKQQLRALNDDDDDDEDNVPFSSVFASSQHEAVKKGVMDGWLLSQDGNSSNNADHPTEGEEEARVQAILRIPGSFSAVPAAAAEMILVLDQKQQVQQMQQQQQDVDGGASSCVSSSSSSFVWKRTVYTPATPCTGAADGTSSVAAAAARVMATTSASAGGRGQFFDAGSIFLAFQWGKASQPLLQQLLPENGGGNSSIESSSSFISHSVALADLKLGLPSQHAETSAVSAQSFTGSGQPILCLDSAAAAKLRRSGAAAAKAILTSARRAETPAKKKLKQQQAQKKKPSPKRRQRKDSSSSSSGDDDDDDVSSDSDSSSSDEDYSDSSAPEVRKAKEKHASAGGGKKTPGKKAGAKKANAAAAPGKRNQGKITDILKEELEALADGAPAAAPKKKAPQPKAKKPAADNRTEEEKELDRQRVAIETKKNLAELLEDIQVSTEIALTAAGGNSVIPDFQQ